MPFCKIQPPYTSVVKTTVLFTLLSLSTEISYCAAEEYVGGHIRKDTRWNAEDGPFIVERDIIVDKGVRLTITPGAKIIFKKPKVFDTTAQYDSEDSLLASIKVLGSLNCIGKSGKWISFRPYHPKSNMYGWYGIIFDNAMADFTEIAFTDIANAYRGITIKECAPVIRNALINYNHIGIYCSNNGNAKIYNCNITQNLVSGIQITEANPHIANCIIFNNRNNGILCDGVSKIKFEYNCMFNNLDGNFLDCDPQLGFLPKKSTTKIVSDFAKNIYTDALFAGSTGDSIAREQDLGVPTRKSKIIDTALANIYYSDQDTMEHSEKSENIPKRKYELSEYSPCKESGLPGAEFKDSDGTRNDMGIWGGPDLLVEKKTIPDLITKPSKQAH